MLQGQEMSRNHGTPRKRKSVVDRAIEMFDSPSEFARRLSKQAGKHVSRQAVNNWKQRGEFSKDIIKHVHQLTRIAYNDLFADPPSDDEDESGK